MATRMLGRAVFGAFSRSVTPAGARSCCNASRVTQNSSRIHWIAAGIGFAGSAYVFGVSNTNNAASSFDDLRRITVKGTEYLIEDEQWANIVPPQFTVSRKVDGPTDLPGVRLTLFQYQTCPFCCKVRAFLDFVGVPYDVVEVDPVLRQQIKFSTYRKVPILLLQEGDNCWQLNDSTVIISILQSYLLNKNDGIRKYLGLYRPVKTKDDSGKQVTEVYNKYNIMFGVSQPDMKAIQEEIRWRKWADEVLVHVLSPNVYRTREEALQAFNYFSEAGDWERLFPAWERYMVIYVGATAMYFVGKRLKRKYNLKDDVRLSFYDECTKWVRNLKGKTFAGGEEPNLADLAVFGVLNSVEGCSAFQDVLQHTKIQRWYDDMKKVTRRSE
ncbi:prostaglandin E synthase 2 [Galendromus occidentalis]|uniref:Prostaglandin E synthase 2 n=1 Tax=Galendromus occidentalis TaxID=34638 RepID=A0AAJ6QN99_9ACAR|nr:prostaglandin E synthase 2 [Galendromus occidentalis]